MTPEAQHVWSGLEFRRPALLRLVEPLSAAQMMCRPAPGRNSVAWQLWHIAEVEDNWIRDKLLDQSGRYPFRCSVRDAADNMYPDKQALLTYMGEVRGLSRQRLEVLSSEDFARPVSDEHFGELTVRDVWAGVITSFAWHAGQVALTVGMMGPSETA